MKSDTRLRFLPRWPSQYTRGTTGGRLVEDWWKAGGI